MSVIVQVMQEDIVEGVRNSCHECPVARALSRYYKRPVEVWGNGAVMGGERRIGLLSARAVLAIKNYDMTGVMLPFEVEVVVG